MRTTQSWLWAALLGIGIGSPATAMSPDEARRVIQDRIFKYREMGTAFKNMKDELSSARPDLIRIQSSARLIQEHGEHMLDWFPPGSEPAAAKGWLERILGWFSFDDAHAIEIEGTKSDAKLAIWVERAQFEQDYRAFVAQAAQMRKVADAGQIPLIAAQHKKLGQTCSGCHDEFREESD